MEPLEPVIAFIHVIGVREEASLAEKLARLTLVQESLTPAVFSLWVSALLSKHSRFRFGQLLDSMTTK